MQAGYFKLAWSDIRQSKGWLKKLLLLALVACIPVFGWIVVYGYLFGWARDMAWGVHGPLPERVFGNEDGKLYVRGASVFVVMLLFSLVPAGISLVGTLLLGGDMGRIGILTNLWGEAWSWWFVSLVLGVGLVLATATAAVLAALLSWVGSMRVSIYGRVSAGFQLGRMWAMLRHDAKGIARIFGMVLLWTILGGLAVSLVIMAAAFLLTLGGLVVFDGIIGELTSGFGGFGIVSVATAVLGALTVSAVVSLVVTYALSLPSVFVTMLYVRALGYWTMQFDVPHWRGQEDPLPFEG